MRICDTGSKVCGQMRIGGAQSLRTRLLPNGIHKKSQPRSQEDLPSFGSGSKPRYNIAQWRKASRGSPASSLAELCVILLARHMTEGSQ